MDVRLEILVGAKTKNPTPKEKTNKVQSKEKTLSFTNQKKNDEKINITGLWPKKYHNDKVSKKKKWSVLYRVTPKKIIPV